MVGQTISRYKILAKLGEGGMGVVYKAEDTRLRRVVALKFLRPEALESEELKARFLVEAQAAAALDHPNICTVYEIDEAEGQTFLAMAYIDGGSVRQKTKQRPLPLADALDIAIQVAEGLQVAHEKGVVHRDIKSANIMLTGAPYGPGHVKITDFGLAQLGGGAKLTLTGTMLGTPAYMSPEQAQRRPLDRRTDIWSLGVVIYEMLTGRLPFEADREQAVLYSIINEAHEPITALRVGLPIILDRIVGKAMAKDPEERYQHVDEMVVDLRMLRKGLPADYREPAPARPRRRNILLAAAGAFVALLALAVGLNPGGLRDRIFGRATPAPIESVAVLPLENLTGDPEQEYFADGMTDALIANLSKIGTLTVISRTSSMRYKNTEKALPEIARELGVDSVVEGSVVRDAGRVRISAQLIDAATDQHLWADSYERELISILALQREIAEAIAREMKGGTLTPLEQTRLAGARWVNPEAYEAYLKGTFYVNQSTPEGLRKGVEYLNEAVEKDPADARAHAGLAYGYVTLSHGFAARRDLFPRARAAAEAALKLDETLAEAHSVLADVRLYYDWDYAGAEQAFQRAFELDPNIAITHVHYSWRLALLGRLDEAIAEHKRARELDPLNPMHAGTLAWLYLCGGRHEEAMDEARKSLDLDPDHRFGHSVMAEVYAAKGMDEEAVGAARKAAASPAFRFSLGRACAAAGREDEARKILAELEAGEATLWDGFTVPSVYVALGDNDGAFQWLEKAYEMRSPWLPWIGVEFLYEPLRDDPRLHDLLDRMNVPR